ncbi:hypothetical protein EC973_008419 [Apophysomyces ossiformis]|uniref:Uncharacterized protein n=1 Tax=Apophysomyces ossiformis TaxID=679940 RepID=A0A8H7ER28_9FUNG|nr:hypothetical protein EC973_008419 [Apophysomyces ossiformis]
MIHKVIFAFAVILTLLFDCEGAACSGVNQATLNLIESFAGFVPSPKPDPVGLPTVGYDHLCQSRGCSKVPFRFPLTKANAEALLEQDIKTFTGCLDSYINDNVRVNDNQWGALASWVLMWVAVTLGPHRLSDGSMLGKTQTQWLLKSFLNGTKAEDEFFLV